MATKKEVQKRRVEAQKQAAAHAAAVSRRDRRRRLLVGGLAGILAIAMIASLGGALFVGDDSPDVDDFPVDLEDAPIPVAISPPPPGESLIGETPCPATDGTQARTTRFETAPPFCITAEAAYEVGLVTNQGPMVVTIDPTVEADAANLFVTNAWYGVYDDVPFWLVVEDGLAITGDTGPGNTGFTIPTAAAERGYQRGDVIMWTDISGGIGSQFAIVGSDLIATILSADPVHPIIGSITVGTDVVDQIISVAGAPGGVGPRAEVIITDVDVTELTP